MSRHSDETDLAEAVDVYHPEPADYEPDKPSWVDLLFLAGVVLVAVVIILCALPIIAL